MAYSHQIIPHYHFEDYDSYRLHVSNHDGSDHDHNSRKHKSDNMDESENEHHHHFPFHQHHSEDEGDFLKASQYKVTQSTISLLVFYTVFQSQEIVRYPYLENIKYFDKLFRINSTFEPGAIGLRAPPSIA